MKSDQIKLILLIFFISISTLIIYGCNKKDQGNIKVIDERIEGDRYLFKLENTMKTEKNCNIRVLIYNNTGIISEKQIIGLIVQPGISDEIDPKVSAPLGKSTLSAIPTCN